MLQQQRKPTIPLLNNGTPGAPEMEIMRMGEANLLAADLLLRQRTIGDVPIKPLSILLPRGTMIARHYTVMRPCPRGKRKPASRLYICRRDGQNVVLKIISKPEVVSSVYRELLVWQELEKFLPMMFFNPPLCDEKLDTRTLSFRCLGYSVEMLMELFGVVPLHATMLLAADMLCAIKILHDCGWVHRNIQPRHFCLGLREGGTLPHSLYLIDLSMAQRFVLFDPAPEVPDTTFTPDPIYSSPDVMEEKTFLRCTRRDDLLSWFYTVISMRRCNFWKMIKGKTQFFKRELEEDRLVVGFGPLAGPGMAAALAYLRAMDPEARPDYSFLFTCLITSMCMIYPKGIPPGLPEKPEHFALLHNYEATMSNDEAMAIRTAIINRDACYQFRDERNDAVEGENAALWMNLVHESLNRPENVALFAKFEEKVSRGKIPHFFEYEPKKRKAAIKKSKKKKKRTKKIKTVEEPPPPMDPKTEIKVSKKVKKKKSKAKMEENVILCIQGAPVKSKSKPSKALLSEKKKKKSSGKKGKK